MLCCSLMCHVWCNITTEVLPVRFEILMRPPTKPHAHACVILGQPMLTYRSGVLQCFDLKLSDFPDQEEANKCADHFISKQRADWPPGRIDLTPDQLCEGCPAADLFWFSNYKGMGTHIAFLCKALSPCRSKNWGWLLPQMRLLSKPHACEHWKTWEPPSGIESMKSESWHLKEMNL